MEAVEVVRSVDDSEQLLHLGEHVVHQKAERQRETLFERVDGRLRHVYHSLRQVLTAAGKGSVGQMERVMVIYNASITQPIFAPEIICFRFIEQIVASGGKLRIGYFDRRRNSCCAVFIGAVGYRAIGRCVN